MEKNLPPYTVALYDYGMTPVSTTVSVTASPTGFDIHIWADVDEFLDPAKLISSHSKDFTWKDFAHILMNLEEGFIGDDAIDHVDVSGIDGLRAECLKYAWATEDDGSYPIDYKGFLDWTLTLEEDTIDYLENNYDLSTNGKDFPLFGELLEFINIEEKSNLFAIFESHGLDGRRNSIRELIEALKIQAEKEYLEIQRKLEEKRKQRQLALRPFEDQIRLIAAKYSDFRNHAGGIVAPSDRDIVSRWIEDYVLENGRMPRGRHRVQKRFYNNYRGPGEIDFDEIKKGGP
jgi:hypothetical protein